MKVKTNTLIGPALDWAVAKCEGTLDRRVTLRLGVSACEAKLHKGEVWSLTPGSAGFCQKFQPSTDHGQGGPIIEREKIESRHDGRNSWCAWHASYGAVHGPTMLIAGMRCYVASRLGDEVDVPEELL